jgi:hypothetical protein
VKGKMNLYFQFLTQNQTVEAAQMLALTAVLTQAFELKGRTKVCAQGAISYSTFSEVN